MRKSKEWFTEWFDTKYYHILYQNRDYIEAERFIKNITDFLDFSKKDLLVDLACGKGRHALYLNKLGYNVLGLDLSPNSIDYARHMGSSTLHFGVHDMRNTIPIEGVGGVLNMFTSFGYFDDDTEDIKVLKSVYESLEKGKLMVLDFMNVQKVMQNLVASETKTLDGIDFNITRAVVDGFILKKINFTDKGEMYNFQERVKIIDEKKFDDYFSSVGFNIENKFGNYDLANFDAEESNRLIIVARK